VTGYELFDKDTGNLLGTFASEEEALAAVCRAIGRSGTASVASWLLGRIDGEGPVWRDQELVARALKTVAA